MFTRIKNYSKDWNLFEKIYVLAAIIFSVSSAIIFHSPIINPIYTISFLLSALLLSKGKIECFLIYILSIVLSVFVNYNQGYYGEIIINLCIYLPVCVAGIIAWSRHQDKKNNVIEIKKLSIKEIVLTFLAQPLLFVIYYFGLKCLNTSLLIVSALSLMLSLLACYFQIRRSIFTIYCYFMNDFVLFAMWLVPVLQGQSSVISVLVLPTLLIINDAYGIYNWKRITRLQKLDRETLEQNKTEETEQNLT